MANNCEYRGSSCKPFSSMESIARCRAFRLSGPEAAREACIGEDDGAPLADEVGGGADP